MAAASGDIHPAVTLLQRLDPEESVYVPGVHVLQSVAPKNEYDPAGQDEGHAELDPAFDFDDGV